MPTGFYVHAQQRPWQEVGLLSARAVSPDSSPVYLSGTGCKRQTPNLQKTAMKKG
jgi:hypothetical protein